MTLTNLQIEELKASIHHVLRNKFDWAIDEISFFANGVINAVFLVKEKNLGRLAVRIPWRSEEQMMDKESSAILSLKKEAALSEHCFKHHLPVPKVHKLYLSENINFLVSDFIDGDDKEISSFAIGELTSQLHHIPIDGLSIIGQDGRSLPSIISKRITSRAGTLGGLMKQDFLIPSTEELERVLNSSQINDCLLHLDIRHPNLIGKQGHIKAIVDWDNAFIGNPIMELMRISESQELHVEEFLKGYRDLSILERTDGLIQNIYRLDTALMLAILFTTFVPDSLKREYYVNRVQMLIQEIKIMVG
ncbi:phosphotransferase family protein [Bacillus sp. S/N-304-OC-R1]|uniref:phosphotransferase family protein n=1 Tax=Bacillus sp. S/N-304-OC-R1 TaxID=2758034 RepID=UPI001C8F07B6|nr:aminoglycoside phosphotransferase family protein [Bacillus sp. S/N-304-OC-R1]MBY0121978.1 aminoglycoside phosphotransferase family protein [Bacillus sp. S/N-304-OC-R1]